jgi:hypothetical protein
LSVFHFYPRLTPWAAFFRRFAAGNRCLCTTSVFQDPVLTLTFKALRHPNRWRVSKL